MAVISVEEFRRMVEEQNRKDAAAMKPGHSRSNRTPEHDMQVRCVNWFADCFPEYEPYFWATPNGGYRSAKTAKAMKAEGQKAGVPDLFLAYPAKGYHGLFIEMKKSEVGKKGGIVGKGKTSDAQEARMAALTEVGYLCVVCYTEDQFKDTIKHYLLI